MSLTEWMLKTARGYVIKHKGIFMNAIIAFADTLPDPTREEGDGQVKRHNSLILLEKGKKFLEYDSIKNRTRLYKAAIKIFIDEYEHDADETHRIDWWVEELANSEWEPRPIGHPVTCWNEPDPFGGGHLIKDETLKQKVFRRRMRILEESNEPIESS